MHAESAKAAGACIVKGIQAKGKRDIMPTRLPNNAANAVDKKSKQPMASKEQASTTLETSPEAHTTGNNGALMAFDNGAMRGSWLNREHAYN